MNTGGGEVMFWKTLFKSHKDYGEEIAKARIWLEQADAIVIRIGSGFTPTVGVKEHFRDYFRMGYRKVSELEEMYSLVTRENMKAYWGFWARYIKIVGYDNDAFNGYRDLVRLVSHKNYFVYTYNVDALPLKAGFDKEKVYEANGDCRFLQCSNVCTKQLFESEPWLEGMIQSMKGSLEIDGRKVPRCPNCGGVLIPYINLESSGKHLFEVLDTMPNEINYRNFLEAHKQQNIVYLELGMENKIDDNDLVLGKRIQIHTKAHIPTKANHDSNEIIFMQGEIEEILAELADGIRILYTIDEF